MVKIIGHQTPEVLSSKLPNRFILATVEKFCLIRQKVTSELRKHPIISSFYVLVSKAEFIRTTTLLSVEKYRLDRRPIDTTISTESSSRFRSICNHIRI